MTAHVVKKRAEEQLGEYQDKILKTQREEVQNIYKTMRGWRHDYHNHMQKIKAHLALGQFMEVTEYLNRLEADLDAIDVVVRTGNAGVDAILNSKLSSAPDKDIEINCKAKVPDNLLVSDVDLCVIIGNLIDNSLESCGKMKETDKKFIRIYMGVFKEQLYISVMNTTNEHRRKAEHELISMKRGNHGHGLKRVDNIVAKYNGYINRKNEPGVFVTEIMLPL
ncbi:MAG: GHKL domain-containing protein [Lachnospiraceae bacterium]|nr:GHKL domain-containing protein [Lachnospiraceae bacterium]